MRRACAIPSLLAAALCLTACSEGGSGQTIIAGGVAVTASLHGGEVRVLLAPTMAGFHIYGLSLPDHGVDGLGVPTRVVPTGSITATGSARADRAEQQLTIADLGVTLPVFPAGPVTVTLPVRRGAGRAAVTLTFGACDAHLCLPPVVDRQIPVDG